MSLRGTSTEAESIWRLVHAERAALVEDLSDLTDEQWASPSLCPGWTVHDVAAHLVDCAKTTTGRVALAMVRARFDFDRANQAGMERERGTTPEQTLARLRAVVTMTASPPASLDSRLVEEVVHGEDIRRPLALSHDYAPEAVTRAIGYQARTSASMGGSKQRIAGLRLVANDTDLSIGDGPEVTGAALDLLLAITGRGGLDRLDGNGVAALEARA